MNLYRTPQDPEDIYYKLGESILRWYRGSVGWLAEPSELPASREKLDFKDIPQDLQEEIMAVSIRLRTINVSSNNGHLSG
ncbi:MAG: hypothetical protein VX294_01980 [Candidatus Latescibacterota bacterium]|nr:hypothetical protein [Candidatus Latescibacterota bacterium]